MTDLGAKLRKTLAHIEIMTDCGGGKYPGMHYDLAPMQCNRLRRMGYVAMYMPENPSHKERVTITAAGRAALHRATP